MIFKYLDFLNEEKIDKKLIAELDPYGEEDWDEETLMDLKYYRKYNPLIFDKNLTDYPLGAPIYYSGNEKFFRIYRYYTFPSNVKYLYEKKPFLFEANDITNNYINNFSTNNIWYHIDYIPDDWLNKSAELRNKVNINEYLKDEYVPYEHNDYGLSYYPLGKPVKLSSSYVLHHNKKPEDLYFVIGFREDGKYYIIKYIDKEEGKDLDIVDDYNLLFDKKYFPSDWIELPEDPIKNTKFYELKINIDNDIINFDIYQIYPVKDGRNYILNNSKLGWKQCQRKDLLSLYGKTFGYIKFDYKDLMHFTNNFNLNDPLKIKEFTALIKRRMTAKQTSYTSKIRKINTVIQRYEKNINVLKDDKKFDIKKSYEMIPDVAKNKIFDSDLFIIIIKNIIGYPEMHPIDTDNIVHVDNNRSRYYYNKWYSNTFTNENIEKNGYDINVQYGNNFSILIKQSKLFGDISRNEKLEIIDDIITKQIKPQYEKPISDTNINIKYANKDKNDYIGYKESISKYKKNFNLVALIKKFIKDF